MGGFHAFAFSHKNSNFLKTSRQKNVMWYSYISCLYTSIVVLYGLGRKAFVDLCSRPLHILWNPKHVFLDILDWSFALRIWHSSERGLMKTLLVKKIPNVLLSIFGRSPVEFCIFSSCLEKLFADSVVEIFIFTFSPQESQALLCARPNLQKSRRTFVLWKLIIK
jgi:hypothetical protein